MNNHKLLNRTTGTLLMGAALGYAASLLLSPDTRTKHRIEAEKKANELKALLTDPEEQQRVKDIFEENTMEARSIYQDTKTNFITALAALRGGLQEIDKQKYLYTIDRILSELREKRELPKKQIDKLKKYLSDDYQKLKSNVPLD